jgi:tetratricopeptide (TPR) repeat protein
LLVRFLKHTFFFLAIGCLILFTGCKAKKASQAPAPAASPKEGSSMNRVMFDLKYVDACTARMKGNLQEALKLFNECAVLDPANPAVKYELGTIYKLLGVNDQALANAKACASADPKNEWYQLLLVECYNATKQYGQAVKVREALVKNFPDNTEFREDLAIAYSITGQYDKALGIYNDLERAYGTNEQITINKVKLLKQSKKLKDIESELIKLSESNKSESRYYSYLADFYMENGELEKAKKNYDKILSVDPGNPLVNLALHDYYSAQGKNEEAFEHLKKAFQNPDLDVVTKSGIVTSFYKRSLEISDAKAKSQGMALAQIMIQVHPGSPEANSIYGDFLMLDNQPQNALPYYYQAARNDLRDYVTWGKLLTTEYELSKYDSLERHSARAIELFPSQPGNYLYNGIANIQLKNYKKAVLAFKDGLEFVVDNKTLLLDFYRSLGDASYYAKDYAQSDKAYENALKIDPDNTYVLNNYAYFLSLRNESLDKAEKLSRRTIELKPNDRNYMDTYGWILYQQKKYKEAEEWLANAARSGPNNPNILEHYGDVLYRLNKVDEALRQWNAAKQAGGNSESLLKKIRDKKLE